MKRKFALAILNLFFISNLFANDSIKDTSSEDASNWTLFSDVTFGVGKSQAQVAASWKMAYGFWNKKILVGMGPRYTMLGGNASHTYVPTTSSNKLNSSLVIDEYLFAALNLTFEVRVALVEWLELGANIDLIGFGGGKNANATYTSNSNGFNGSPTTDVPNLNYFGAIRHDRGQLNSEIFVAIRPWTNWALRTGLSHYLSETETKTFLDGQRRFRRFSNLIFISLENRF